MKYFSKFEDETVEEAINSHSNDGYDTLEEAIECCNFNGKKGEKVQVFDENHKVVYNGVIE